MTLELLLSLIFLIGSTFLTAISTSMGRLGKSLAESIAGHQKGIASLFIKKTRRDFFAYAITSTKSLLIIGYALSAFGFVFSTEKAPLLSSLVILAIFLFAEAFFRILGIFRPKAIFRSLCQFASLFLFILFPISYLFFTVNKKLMKKTKEITPMQIRDKIMEILHDSEFAPHLDPQDQKLILSVVSFKSRIAREVMVPRIDMFTMDAETPIREAAKGFLEEGYSRIPVWKESVDNIIGTLYYKDLLNIYFKHRDSELDSPIEKLLKPIVYAPETKKISSLLQEFRSKQIHLAIVVDEYGGTEGIVTIEDILEELVGEIADEYDFDEEALYSQLPSGGWIVDAKMTIIDIEEELGISIPQNPEYDTIGGFVFQKAGAIPSKGWRLHQDNFDLEVLSSSERTVEKIRITPH